MSTDQLNDLDILWRRTASFWRDFTDGPTQETARRLQLSQLVSLMEAQARVSDARSAMQPQGRPYLVLPWWFQLVSADAVQEARAWTVGTDYDIGEAGLVVGEGGIPRWVVRTDRQLVSADALASYPGPDAVYLGSSEFSILPGGLIVFDVDPTSVFPVYSVGGANHFGLWLRNPQFDVQSVQNTLGHLVAAAGPSNDSYGLGVQALRDILLSPTREAFRRGVASAVGEPLAAQGETVEDVVTTAGQLVITTDAGVYLFDPAANATVSVSDVLGQSQLLTDSATILHGVEIADASSALIPGLSFNATSLGGAALQVTAPNLDTQWVIDDQVSPIAVSFPLGGDAQEFWSDAWARSQAAGTDLATVLGITSAADVVPVNPMKFLCEQFYGPALTVVVAKSQAVGGERSRFLDWYRPHHPAHARLVCITLLGDLGNATIDLQVDAGAEVAGFYFDTATAILDLALTSDDPTPFVGVA